MRIVPCLGESIPFEPPAAFITRVQEIEASSVIEDARIQTQPLTTKANWIPCTIRPSSTHLILMVGNFGQALKT